MSFHIFIDKRTKRNNFQSFVLNIFQYLFHKGRSNSLSFKLSGNFSVGQVNFVARPDVFNFCNKTINMKFILMFCLVVY